MPELPSTASVKRESDLRKYSLHTCARSASDRGRWERVLPSHCPSRPPPPGRLVPPGGPADALAPGEDSCRGRSRSFRARTPSDRPRAPWSDIGSEELDEHAVADCTGTGSAPSASGRHAACPAPADESSWGGGRKVRRGLRPRRGAPGTLAAGRAGGSPWRLGVPAEKPEHVCGARSLGAGPSSARPRARAFSLRPLPRAPSPAPLLPAPTGGSTLAVLQAGDHHDLRQNADAVRPRRHCSGTSNGVGLLVY